MRITQAEVLRRAEQYRKDYGFDSGNGWAQIRGDLKPVKEGQLELPRAVAYGAYMALMDLLDY